MNKIRNNIKLEDYLKNTFKSKQDKKCLEREYKLASIALNVAELRKNRNIE